MMALPIGAGAAAVRSIRWSALLPPRSDGTRVTWTRVAPVLLIGYLANAVLPARLGEPVRAYAASSRERLDLSETVGSVVLERMMDTGTVAVIAFAAALLVGAPVWVLHGTALVLGAAVVALGLVFALALGPVRRLGRRIGTVFGRGWAEAAVGALRRFARGARGARVGDLRRVFTFAIVMSVFAWALDGSMFWLAGVALDLRIGYEAALLTAGMTALATALPSAPGYVGTWELAAATTAGFVGVPPAEALAYAVLGHVLVQVPAAAGGALCLAAVALRLPRLARDPRLAEPSASGDVVDSR